MTPTVTCPLQVQRYGDSALLVSGADDEQLSKETRWAAVHAEGMCASLVDGCCPRLRRVFGTHRASYRVLPREFSPRNDLITVDVRWCT